MVTSIELALSKEVRLLAVKHTEVTIVDYAVSYARALASSTAEGAAYMVSIQGTTVPCNERKTVMGTDPQSFAGSAFPAFLSRAVTLAKDKLVTSCTIRFPSIDTRKAKVRRTFVSCRLYQPPSSGLTSHRLRQH